MFRKQFEEFTIESKMFYSNNGVAIRIIRKYSCKMHIVTNMRRIEIERDICHSKFFISLYNSYLSILMSCSAFYSRLVI